MPQARAADTLTHLFLLTVRTDRLMHSTIAASRHTHVAQIGGGQVEQADSLDNTGFCAAGNSSPSTGSYGSGSSPGRPEPR